MSIAPIRSAQQASPTLNRDESSARQTPPATTPPATTQSLTRQVDMQMTANVLKSQLLAAAPRTASTGTYYQQIVPQGPFGGSRVNPSAPPGNSALSADSGFNGSAFRVAAPGVNPSAEPAIIFVNGINTSRAGAADTAREISRLTGRPVDFAYNNSDPAVGGNLTYENFTREARDRARNDYDTNFILRTTLQSRGINRDTYVRTATAGVAARAALDPATAEWSKRNALHNPPAAQAQANLILAQLQATPDKPVQIVGYSQGAAITSEAVRYVERELVRAYGNDKANQMLGRLQVMTLGGAANEGNYPSAVKVTSVAHQNDPISQYFGVNRDALGRGNAGDFFNFIRNNNGGSLAQHTNYLDGQTGARGRGGNPAVERLLQDWSRNPPTSDTRRILPDYTE